ncbi:hypothetical protein QVD17_33383 [Tagetes erecta]|uniref:Uncharacterized protein n=1 Tax=Tagetes erecta TaxID=13708 RepID=A0AAD8K363_TARER|nr:hypothetical protein QVD17_33383 [Tagetes erecta]
MEVHISRRVVLTRKTSTILATISPEEVSFTSYLARKHLRSRAPPLPPLLTHSRVNGWGVLVDEFDSSLGSSWYEASSSGEVVSRSISGLFGWPLNGSERKPALNRSEAGVVWSRAELNEGAEGGAESLSVCEPLNRSVETTSDKKNTRAATKRNDLTKRAFERRRRCVQVKEWRRRCEGDGV